MVATKSQQGLDKNRAQTIVKNIYQHLEETHNQSHTPQLHDLEQFFSRNFELTSNGKAISHNLNEYVSRIERLKRKYSKFSIKPSKDEPLASGNRFAVHYTLNLTPRSGGQPLSVEIMAIATIDNEEKISQWHQTAVEQGAAHWDA